MANLSCQLSLFLLLSAFLLPSSAKAENCVDDQTPVSLQAILAEKTFAGPPNYSDIKTGDTPETVIIAKLLKPACLTIKNENGTATEIKAQELQLVFLGQHTPHILAKLYARKLQLEGTLFEAQTGHHYTPILMIVSQADALIPLPKTTMPSLAYHEILETLASGTEQLVLSVQNQQKEIYRHTLVRQVTSQDAVALELGAYKIGPNDLTLYSYWANAGNTQTAPEGVRKQVFAFNKDGQLQQQSGIIDIRVGAQSEIHKQTGNANWQSKIKEPPQEAQAQIALFFKLIKQEYAADFLVRADDSYELRQEVMTVLKKQAGAFTADWHSDPVLKKHIQQPF